MAVALIAGTVLVVACYYFIDRPVAWFVHNHRFFPAYVLQWPPLLSSGLKAVAPVAIVLAVLWWAWKPAGRLQQVLLAIAANVIVTTLFKQLLKWACGRYWPETWISENPSLVNSGDYGFNPFHLGSAYEAFPSGHAAVFCGVLSILWLCYPRWRWLYAVFGASLCLALVGMNYHFVGDVVSGVMLGTATGICTVCLFRLRRRP